MPLDFDRRAVYVFYMASKDKPAGQLLAQWRRDRGLSPEALSWELRVAKLDTVTGRQIRRIERDGVIPNVRTQFALARFFDTSPTQIWQRERVTQHRQRAKTVVA